MRSCGRCWGKIEIVDLQYKARYNPPFLQAWLSEARFLISEMLCRYINVKKPRTAFAVRGQNLRERV